MLKFNTIILPVSLLRLTYSPFLPLTFRDRKSGLWRPYFSSVVLGPSVFLNHFWLTTVVLPVYDSGQVYLTHHPFFVFDAGLPHPGTHCVLPQTTLPFRNFFPEFTLNCTTPHYTRLNTIIFYWNRVHIFHPSLLSPVSSSSLYRP